MSFLTYHLNYYRQELGLLEKYPADADKLYHAKQLLKILDDLLDEGYTELNEVLEQEIHGVSRLRRCLSENGAAPFPLSTGSAPKPHYPAETIELTAAIENLIHAAGNLPAGNSEPFPERLVRFCRWIGYEPDTAYIFLLRDTLLPYVYYKSRGRNDLHPWLLGRKAIERITGTENADDEIRSSIITALEKGADHDFAAFCDAALPPIRDFLDQTPQIEENIGTMLKSIRAKRILVVESGCSGTFPMLLKAMDDRVEIRMYTTYPYLLDVYGKRIFTPAYEENQLFETMYSQDVLFRFADLKGGSWYVNQCTEKVIWEKALCEVKAML